MSATAWTPLPESLARLHTLASPYTGIVRRTYDLLRSPDDSRLFRISADVAEGAALVGDDLEQIRSGSGGFAAVRESAVAAAIAETAERYSACFVPERELVLATARELGPAAVAPERFALFHERQHRGEFPFSPFTADLRVRWVRGCALPDGGTAWLPAQLVFLGWCEDDSGEVRIAHATSNGLACGATPAEATVAGLLEALERDAFMLTWNGRLSLPLLDWSSSDELCEHDSRYFAPTGLRYRAIDLSAFWRVPTVVGVVRGRDRGALGVGAGAATTVEEAWRKAFAEAFAVRTWGRVRRLDGGRRRFADDFSDVRTFADHVELYASPEHAARATFLDASSEVRPVSEVEPLPAATPADALASIVERLAERGLTAYAVDVTAPDVRAAGLTVVKTLVPELVQLDVDHRARFLGGRRQYEAAFELGLRDTPLRFEGLNPDPHPFP